MNVLVLGGTRLMGKYLVKELIARGHNVTIATRGLTKDAFGDKVRRLTVDRYNEENIKHTLSGEYYDIVYDNLAYGSLDVIKLLSHLKCGKVISISSTAVCQKLINTTEEDFDPTKHPMVLCERKDLPYDEVKRQAEVALFCRFAHIPSIAVRFPFAVSIDDHTKRLYFYVEHVAKGIPMHIDNMDAQMSFVHSEEAGKFLAFLSDCHYTGIINGASSGTVSIHEILDYIESKTGKKAIVSSNGDTAPYNGEVEYSINTNRATSLGFVFSNVREWIFELIDQMQNSFSSH